MESRAIIARAYNRLGFVQMVLSGNTSETRSRSPRRVQAEADYQRSLVLFERLHAEHPTDRKICRYYADALGVQGWAWQLSKMDRPEKARPLYGRAIETLARPGPLHEQRIRRRGRRYQRLTTRPASYTT